MKIGFEASTTETLCFWEKKRNHLHSHQIFWGRPWKYYTEIVWHWISNGLSGVILVHTILCSFPTLFSGNKTEDWKFNWNIWNKFNWTTWKWRDKRSKLLCEEKPNVQVTLFSLFFEEQYLENIHSCIFNNIWSFLDLWRILIFQRP